MQVFELMNKNVHNSTEGLIQIQNIASKLSGKMNKNEKILLGSRLPTNMTTCAKHYSSEWVQGLVQAEGSFYSSIVKSSTSALGSSIILTFEISQEVCELNTIKSLINFFSCGFVVNKNTCPSYRVQSRKDLIKYIFPFFDQYPSLWF